MIQNNISSILKNNPIIPVATIDELSKVDKYYEILIYQNINCIEITLRNDISWDAIEIFKKNTALILKLVWVQSRVRNKLINAYIWEWILWLAQGIHRH